MDDNTGFEVIDVMRFSPHPPGPGEVHVWQIHLGNPENIPLISISGVLSAAERKRMVHYRHSRDADRYMMRRYWIRIILAGYLRSAPESIQIIHSPEGKPVFTGVVRSNTRNDSVFPERNNIELSISHTRDTALFAVTTADRIGVDIECIDANYNPDELSHFSCSKCEQKSFDRVQDSDKLSWFLKRWTAKEACLKFLGLGLYADPREYECRYQDDGIFGVYHLKGDEERALCRVIPIPVGTDYIGSLAVPVTFNPVLRDQFRPVPMNNYLKWISLSSTA